MLFTRLLVAVVAIPLVLGVAAVGGLPFWLLLAAACLAAARELERLVGAMGCPVSRPLLYGGGLLLLGTAYVEGGVGAAALGGGITLYTLALAALAESPRARAGAVWSGGGALYTGGLLACLYLLRGLDWPPWGEGGVLLLLAPVWITDAAAYGAGRLFGRRQLAPRISPHKTWEGAVAGCLAGAATVWGVGRLVGLPLGPTLLLAVTLPVVAQLGDLAESRLKRAAGVKDTGRLFPGHGGMLDRLDSLLPSALLVYLLTTLVG